jgi:hypothetical protein
MFVSLNFDWPQELQSLYAAMSVFNFNIQITAPEVRGSLSGWGGGGALSYSPRSLHFRPFG